jgi:plastocyanin
MRRPTTLLLVALALSACTTGDAGSPPAVQADIRSFAFDPDVIEITVGQRVTWTNGDATRHTVTAGLPGQPTGAFDGLLEERGATTTVTFDEPGEHRFFCAPHEFMTGTVIVRD